MKLDEFRKKAAENSEWAPGWQAIDSCLDKLYPVQKPRHLGTNFAVRTIFGGDQYLDGFSVYESAHGHLHIVTYGMSELYAQEDSLGGEWSKWGYEMTIRLPLCGEDDYMWAIDMLANLARYTYTSDRFFEPLQFISAGSNPIREGTSSGLRGLFIVNDPELSGIDTLYGRLDFLQIVGITQQELDALIADENQAQILLRNLQQYDPFFVTDLARTKSCL